jgi:hypothetical protein
MSEKILLPLLRGMHSAVSTTEILNMPHFAFQSVEPSPTVYQNYRRDAYSCLEIIPSRSLRRLDGENSYGAYTLPCPPTDIFEHPPFRIAIGGLD